jgi:hypothetical protein
MKYLPLLLTLAMVSCQEEDDKKKEEADPYAVCHSVGDILAGCGQDADGWNDTCDLFVISDACLQAFEDSTCEELNGAEMPVAVEEACFPACDPAAFDRFCEGDEITLCNDGSQFTARCETVCERDEAVYVGECSDVTSTGQASSSGDDVCWCDS